MCVGHLSAAKRGQSPLLSPQVMSPGSSGYVEYDPACVRA